MRHDDVRLHDLGERRIIEEILRPRYATHGRFGDDCAALPVESGTLLVTTDPCPTPAVETVGFTDPYFRGWLLATINLSDLAAAGAEPIGLLTSLELPAETRLAAFLRLLDGIDDCCADNGTAVFGGNLKESATTTLSATAFGRTAVATVGRRGARPGDLVCVVGPLGDFWATFALLREQQPLDPASQQAVTRQMVCPRPQLAAGRALHSNRLVTCMMDNSDGLFASARMLSEANDLGVLLDFSQVSWSPVVRSAVARLRIIPERFALGWGDWQLVAGLAPAALASARAAAASANAALHVVGEFRNDVDGVALRLDGEQGRLNGVESERFTTESVFTGGIDVYQNQLLTRPLLAGPSVDGADGARALESRTE